MNGGMGVGLSIQGSTTLITPATGTVVVGQVFSVNSELLISTCKYAGQAVGAKYGHHAPP